MNYLLTLFDRQPRRYRVIEGILRGRRTVSILFWGQQYGILHWLRASPQLSRHAFDSHLMLLANHGLLILDQDQLTAQLSQEGAQAVHQFKKKYYWPSYDRWAWTVESSALVARFLLGVQAVSELSHHCNRYVPIMTSPRELNAVRSWLRQPLGRLRDGVYDELLGWSQQLSHSDSRLANLLVHQLPGFGQSGWTDADAVKYLQLTSMELPVMKRDLWAALGHWILIGDGPLVNLCRPLVQTSPLNPTTMQTLRLFKSGYSIDGIARRRHLKMSTIREHLLQAAILMPGCVDLARLLSPDRLQKLQRNYNGPAISWHFDPLGEQDEGQAFFEFRAYQILKSGEDNG